MWNNGVIFINSPEFEKCAQEEENTETICLMTSDGAFS